MSGGDRISRVRDLFAGYRVVLELIDDRYAVSLQDPEGTTLFAQAYRGLPYALEAADEWMRAISDEREFVADDLHEARVLVARLLNEAMARGRLGESQGEPAGATDGDALRDWFEREMGL